MVNEKMERDPFRDPLRANRGIEWSVQSTESRRTGTWQFISHKLLRDPNKCHTICDDLESSFWTLL
ncbi:hypothetical protein NEOLEDRAFT_1141804 [Neolentinus lepideus HHB14362 ss-1]|uniref:Fungal-type protein kinase domain-containing protein n=1 Tax=Neolentinus lepideus HHB14362 ss-1 TaxID=1314782 RepID=A0A165NHW1_9AGAM|nr:hypothetical protein NEOLEDRAFT_1141804 [Neolentinus lepideus HHB14362 ss-1]